jgi:CHAD domain-containing protein
VAKAREIPGLSADDSYASAAAKIVAVRSQELADHAAGVLDIGDIERVHDMRVATRRLRAALEVFEPCFPAKQHRADLREVKALADALGERRDPDVHIDAMSAFAEGVLASQRGGVETVIAGLRERQAAGNETLADALAHARENGLRERLLGLATAAEAEYAR